MKQVFNSSELHIISGLPIEVCRGIYKDNYLPPRTTLDVVQKHYPKFNFEAAFNHFKNNWLKYHDNRDYLLNDPFTETGFKIKRKIKFILEAIPEGQKREVLEIYEQKKEALKNQLSFK